MTENLPTGTPVSNEPAAPPYMQPTSEAAPLFDDQYTSALRALASQQDMSELNVLRAALRLYQTVTLREARGERMVFLDAWSRIVSGPPMLDSQLRVDDVSDPPGYGLNDFFRDAARLNMTANDVASELRDLPEFADCVAASPAPQEEAQQAEIPQDAEAPASPTNV